MIHELCKQTERIRPQRLFRERPFFKIHIAEQATNHRVTAKHRKREQVRRSSHEIQWIANENLQESKGDQVGSVASVGVGKGRSLKPAMSMVWMRAE